MSASAEGGDGEAGLGTSVTLGRACSRARAKAGMTIADVASALGVAASTVSRFENAQSSPQRLIDFVGRYATAVGVAEQCVWREALGVEPEQVWLAVPHIEPTPITRGQLRTLLAILAVLVVAVAGAAFASTNHDHTIEVVEAVSFIAAAEGLAVTAYLISHRRGGDRWARRAELVISVSLTVLFLDATRLAILDDLTHDDHWTLYAIVLAPALWFRLARLVTAKVPDSQLEAFAHANADVSVDTTSGQSAGRQT